jgi:hypothetical protein
MNILEMLPKNNDFILWITTILMFTLLVRLILSIFRMLEAKYIIKDVSCSKIFCKLLWGFSGDPKLDDYWLSALVGFSELVIFPILIFKHKWYYIGFWILIKTTANWGKWKQSRTIFNRFLFGNILSLFFSYLIFHQFFLKEHILNQLFVFMQSVLGNLLLIGLILNFIAAILIAFSIGKCPSEVYQDDEKGRKIHLAAMTHPLVFKFGIILLILGFFLQFVSVFIYI